ncbi:DNA-binding NtrC family response regulator [Pararhizobium capsulatum DSM 1112]|uniref:DNA-binding NtrC family response regulator n=1 Tax=Pararhizobium capsulatum DSM 1112 TaxID=1121113 RepID=A0ABU0BNE1_9HYPH|nr:response regulator [Pararhizobium capsulatum]MDQ0319239.1 DNA-binding NtrC family response regulator [Pararhizobium capsulatum DSM 1112]
MMSETETVAAMTVLYIDDDEALGVLVRRNLGRLGLTVVNATDGASGLARLDEGGIDAVALDHFLTTETGLDVLHQMTTRPDHPPVVYVTGVGETAVVAEALRRGAVNWITKDISSEFFGRLAEALRDAFRRHRASADHS